MNHLPQGQFPPRTAGRMIVHVDAELDGSASQGGAVDGAWTTSFDPTSD
ncbi:hypothetical protein [Amycolatopsis echigonensis]|uniref:Uncharacterized protein n=1 Tax=Amycolatopsis echigonensis TaxID=2576905 RepID=A0A8E2AZT4_9PSEU|nr:hypothetical protein [Amycolatopsis echigonensis]MBB2499004.1 hypothetical protein [Amycolatopsis echigonensis]